jgi:hypothetical protein
MWGVPCPSIARRSSVATILLLAVAMVAPVVAASPGQMAKARYAHAATLTTTGALRAVRLW